MTATHPRGLPGFRFEAPPTARTDILPRMDIAVFIGFAASGPLHTPVRVEDEAEFENVFGTNTPLAWDQEIGEPIYAYLAPAVHSFFRNGGQRCWIVRVAKHRDPNVFPLPGLVEMSFDENAAAGEQGLGTFSPAFATARSQGRWSDGVLVGTVLKSEPVQVVTASPQEHSAVLVTNSPEQIVRGDLIRLQYGERGLFMLIAVDSITRVSPADFHSPPASPGARRLLTKVGGPQAVFLAASALKQPTASVATVRLFASATPTCVAHVPLKARGSASSPMELDWPTVVSDPKVTLFLDIAFEQAPQIGSSVQAIIGEDMLWLTVEQCSVQDAVGSPPSQKVSVTGPAWWTSTQPFSLMSPPGEPMAWTGERLTFGFRVRAGDQRMPSLDNLGFAPKHPRYWNALPNDEDLYPAISTQISGSPPPLWREIARPRFPLAGVKGGVALFVPVNMPYTPGPELGAAPTSAPALCRDGLDEFKLDLFVDSRLSDIELLDLATEADSIRAQMPEVKPFQGIHAAFGVEEATILAVPDAIHRGWTKLDPEVPGIQPSSPLERPEWWHYLPCDPPPAIPRAKEPPRDHFLDCGSEPIPAPILHVEGDKDLIVSRTGTFTLSWPQTVAGEYTLEEATVPDFSDAAQLYSGSEKTSRVVGRPVGNYFYRVRVIKGGKSSDWSNSVGVRVVTADFWLARSRDEHSPEVLLGIHRTLLRTCAARADALAVLGLPDHYRTEQVTEHIQLLAPSRRAFKSSGGGSPEEELAPRLTFGEESALSYGALYHPWALARTPDNQILRTPPDGAACGILARRALERGAWIAPANELWRSLVALTPMILADDRVVLQQAQVNLVRQEPRGFLTLSADTLSTDVDLRPIHVRRLLILLRRLALALGATYVFEPNDAAFRRLVERNFEALLEDLFRKGAFAGATPADSFQVVTGEGLNTAESVELGRFIVELRVAPAQALRFVTIRLVQSGNGNLTVVEG